MKWYTRAWQRGDDEADPSPAYSAYIRQLAPELPPHILAFASSERRHLAVDDANVDRAELDSSAGMFRLQLLNGDLQTGYGVLRLEFEEATVTEPPLDEVEPLLKEPNTEFLAHEVERLGDGRYEVRFLLWPRGELHVRCRDVRNSWESVPARSGFRSEVVGFPEVGT